MRAIPLLTALAVLLLALTAAPPAWAHKIKLFATTEGTAITGTVYVPGGGRVSGADVTATGPDGAALGTAVTDAEGRFSLEATRRVDHLLEVDTGDGHRATFRITAAQLPPTLPGPEGASAAPRGTPAAEAQPAQEAAAPAMSEAALEAVVARAVAAQVNPLREQMAAQEDRLRLQDVLGGLGWIMGVTGIGFYLLARRERRRGGG
ncbi:carboxypeptidase-like regulatory domain-containing protein [Caenispirillum salinarum]|uniref:carboxypeptidase-like regulatory domain-containing protein n=1 Tax=Caenispirillum salinarum TaxID=859058 RepID=UPI0038509B66